MSELTHNRATQPGSLKATSTLRRLVAAALVVVLAGLAVPAAASARGLTSTAVSASTSTLPSREVAEAQLFDLLNQARVGSHLPPLVHIPTLDFHAGEWSQFMASGGCRQREGTEICHRTDLPMIVTLASPKGWKNAGENVGMLYEGGTIQDLHNAFMQSPSHRANIFATYYNAVGVGVRFSTTGTLYVTFEFFETVGEPNSTDPTVGFPEPPEGATAEEAFAFYVNFIRSQAGLPPLAIQPVLQREARFWSDARMNGACGRLRNCNRRDTRDLVKAAVGSGQTRWWGSGVGVSYASDTSAQVSWFVSNTAIRNMFLRRDANLIGVGITQNSVGLHFISFTILTVKNPTRALPSSADSEPCGWVVSTLKVRSKGPQVRVAQCALAKQGLWDGGLDGKFSSTMKAAVKAFQSAHKLRANGILDPKTRKALGVS